MGHGVNLVSKGVSGKTQNQRFEFNMSINNTYNCLLYTSICV